VSMPAGVGATSEAGRACRRDNLIVWNERDFALADERRFDVNLVVDGRIIEVWNCGYEQGVWQ
jgi:hypothetical protein